ncbi:hypothetical protein EXIGLDRAFT_838026 [Exidia glandulosa HHB12029]|uniref:Uncharacterized protein n=1 Tax=Exidia glandulosa HHB12029 TaxID=1314781 RepID=A0A165G9E6_EXIGL|nr:hypothetical protein EXIGLDRAFT_838026 [Exidia glandulosa HHB12029]
MASTCTDNPSRRQLVVPDLCLYSLPLNLDSAIMSIPSNPESELSFTGPPRLDKSHVPACFADGIFPKNSIGQVYWVYCSVHEGILQDLSAYSVAPLTERMESDRRWLRSVVDAGDPTHFLKLRPCIVFTVYQGGQQADVVTLATFHQKPIWKLDQHIRHYAVSVTGTFPWPRDAPILHLNNTWPEAPCYAIVTPFPVRLYVVHSPYRQGRFCLRDGTIEQLAEFVRDKAAEYIALSREQQEKRHNSYKPVGRSNRWQAEFARLRSNGCATQPPPGARTITSIGEEDEPAGIISEQLASVALDEHVETTAVSSIVHGNAASSADKKAKPPRRSNHADKQPPRSRKGSSVIPASVQQGRNLRSRLRWGSRAQGAAQAPSPAQTVC